MDRPIPSLNALRSFDATARHLNQTRAATELHVTPSAVSKQIAMLEDYFGFALFEWRGKEMTLTARGEECAQITRGIFRSLSRDLQHLMRPDQAPLRLVVDNDFAQLWLAPRLSKFRSLHPEINIELRIMLDGSDAPENFDCALSWDKRDWERGAEIEPVFLNSVFLVGAPGARATKAFRKGEALDARELINDRNTFWWGRIVSELGLQIEGRGDVVYPTTAMSLAAAERGEGLVVADEVTSRKQIEGGSLQILSSFRLQTVDAYYAAWNPDVSQDLRVRAFRDWLRGEAEDHRKWFDRVWELRADGSAN